MAARYETDGSAFLPRLHLFCMSMEVGLKAAILVDACNLRARELIQYELGHDLTKIRDYFEGLYKDRLFDQSDASTVASINEHYRKRAFQFFTPPMLGSVLMGYKDLPDIEDVRRMAEI